MPRSEIDQLRQQLNDMRRRHPDDPHLAERIGQIRENLGLLKTAEVLGVMKSNQGLRKQCIQNIAELDQYMKAKRER